MEIVLPIFLFIAGFCIGAWLMRLVNQKELEARESSSAEMELAFSKLSKEALSESQKQFLELAKYEFDKLQSSSGEHLSQKKELIDASLKNIDKSLRQLGEGTTGLREQMRISGDRIDSLNTTTDQLRAILSSSQARGQWGERMVEDILEFLGLVEKVNYTKQSQEGEGRPDFTFMLPKDKRLNMDVKFPIAHYEEYLATDDEKLRLAAKKQFLADIRNHVRAVSQRSYVDPAGGTVDYVLLFIPNESIYSFINREDHELIDFAMERKIVLCSPLTLYAILSLIRQSVASFAVEQKAGDLQKLVQDFSLQWEKYGEKLDAMGKSLGAAQNHFEGLQTTRANTLEKPMRKILDLNLDQQEDDPSLPESKQ
ncbi:MAG: recombinase RmuC [Verrucomicrobiales bacterium]|nr:recombinase RmuC [Verrucomicrobiales bacterium]